jgi:hypothetical protein
MAIGDELANLDFQSMIGGPLSAVVRAQAEAANTSVDYIKSVGFDKDTGKPTMVEFTYDKPVETTDSAGNTTVAPATFKLTVPILTMLPIPFIRVEETTIDFNAKINSVQETTTSHSTDFNSSLSAKAGWGPISARLKVSYAQKKSTQTGSKVERTYNLAVHVKAVQDELPAGTDRLLGILENNIQEVKQ